MSSPFNPVVFGGAALLSSPALYAAFEMTMSYEAALVRFAVAWLVAWIGVSMLASVGGSPVDGAPTVPHSLPGIDGPLQVRPAELNGGDDHPRD